MSEAVNPFSSCFLRPGAMPYLYPPGESAETVLSRFSENGRRGAIVGPHGSGKSALLHDLLKKLADDGVATQLMELHDGQRRLPPGWLDGIHNVRATIVAVDGYEQLGRLARWRLRSASRRNQWGLLVTAHKKVHLPTIAEPRIDWEQARRIVAQLVETSPRAAAIVTAQRIEDCFRRHGPDVREMLFELYDVVAQRG